MIRNDGTLVGCGSNTSGQINSTAGTFTAIAAGTAHSIAIRSDGTLVGWGRNDFGQTNVPSGTFTAVSARYHYSLAIRSDGTLVGWGRNDFGQTNVPPGTFTAVAAGEFDAAALRSDGAVVYWYSSGRVVTISGTFTAVASAATVLMIRSDGTIAEWNGGMITSRAGTFTAIAAYGVSRLGIRSGATPGSEFGLRLATDSAAKPGANTWTIWSDRRLKKNIQPLSGALERMLQLHGVTFDWIDPASQGMRTGTEMGLIADEVERVFPQWVGRDPKGYQTLTVGGFEAVTAEAFRELRREKDSQLADLETRLRILEAHVRDSGSTTSGNDVIEDVTSRGMTAIEARPASRIGG